MLENAREVMPGFANSRHTLVEGRSQTGATRGPFDDRSVAFLKGEPVESGTASIPFAFAPLPD
jgi:hypothetical protein